MSIPQELYAHEVIRYLPVRDILTLCQTSPTLYSICQKDATWKFLIGRDYGIAYQGENPREYYMKARHVHEISDIPVELVNQKNLGVELYGMGYEKRGNVYVLANLDPFPYKVFSSDTIILKLLPHPGVKRFRDILPPALHISQGNQTIEISRSDFKDIYEFYSGKRL